MPLLLLKGPRYAPLPPPAIPLLIIITPLTDSYLGIPVVGMARVRGITPVSVLRVDFELSNHSFLMLITSIIVFREQSLQKSQKSHIGPKPFQQLVLTFHQRHQTNPIVEPGLSISRHFSSLSFPLLLSFSLFSSFFSFPLFSFLFFLPLFLLIIGQPAPKKPPPALHACWLMRLDLLSTAWTN